MRKIPLAFVASILFASQGCGPVLLSSPLGLAGKTPEDCKALFSKLDLNGDGILAENEYVGSRAVVTEAFPHLATATDAMLSAHLKGFDADHDGKVTPDEFMRACVASPDPTPTVPVCVDCAAFTTLDRDKTGTISFEEFFLGHGGSKANKEQLVAAFEMADHDGNGLLTAAELCGPDPRPSPSPGDDCRQFLALDRNNDGQVTDEEYLAGKGVTPANKGTLVAGFEALDTNRDGVLTVGELCGPSPKPSASVTPTASPSIKPSEGPSPSVSPSGKPTDKPSPSPKPTDDCTGKFAAFDTDLDGSVNDFEYFQGVGGTQATKYQISADFKALDTNGDGVLSAAELCAQGWPRTATVNIYGPMSPFGPQSVDVMAGGTVTFNNVNSGASWTIRSVGSPSFPDVPLATSPATGTTIPLTAPGSYEYVIDGTNPFVVPGHIIVH